MRDSSVRDLIGFEIIAENTDEAVDALSTMRCA